MCNKEILSLHTTPSSYIPLSPFHLSKLREHLVNETYGTATLSFRDKYLLIFTVIKALSFVIGDIRRYESKKVLSYSLNRNKYSFLYFDISHFFTQVRHYYIFSLLRCHGIKCGLFFDLVQFLSFSLY